MSRSSFICPYPLVFANASLPAAEGTEIHWAYEEGNCAIRCPTVFFTETEMDAYYDKVLWLSVLSVISSSFLLSYYIREVANKRFLVVMFLLGFWLQSASVFFILPQNRNYDVFCDGLAQYVPQDPVCVAQSFLAIYSYIWVSAWGAIYTIDIYFQVHFKFGPEKQKEYRQYYLFCVFVATTVITCIPLACGNFGFDYTTPLQFCLFLFGENQSFFWFTLVLPFGIMLVTSAFFSCLIFKRLHKIFVQSQINSNKRVSARVASKTDSAQDEYTERMRDNYWSHDLDNDFDNDGKILVVSKSTIVNPMSSVQNEMELSGSASSLRHDDGIYPRDSSEVSEMSVQYGDRLARRDLEEAQRSPAAAFPRQESLDMRADSFRTGGSEFYNSASNSAQATASTSHIGVESTKTSNIAICLKKTWQYNGRMILFLFFFCALAIYLLPTLIYMYHTKYDSYVDGTEEFAKCLIKASFQSKIQTQEAVDAAAHKECGSHPENRPPFYLFMSVSYWVASFGIVPLIIFGKEPIKHIWAFRGAVSTVAMTTNNNRNVNNSALSN